MLLLFLLVYLCVSFFLISFFIFSRDRNMISIDTIEFRYYVAIIILVNLGKP